MKSIDEKLAHIFSLCVRIYEVESRTTGFRKAFGVTTDEYELLHSTFDGGFHDTADRMRAGRVSLGALLAFDPVEFERDLDTATAALEALRMKVGAR